MPPQSAALHAVQRIPSTLARLEGAFMRELTDYERGFLRAAERRGGKWCIQGNDDHHKWDYLVEEGYLDRHLGPPATEAVVYVLTEKGSAALCK